MKVYTLSFCSISLINSNLAEVIVDEGIVFDELMVDQYHDFLLNNLDAPFSLLINKRNSYTYTFEAQKIISNLNEVKAIAIVTKVRGSKLSIKTLMHLNSKMNEVAQLFDTRAAALNWLKQLP